MNTARTSALAVRWLAAALVAAVGIATLAEPHPARAEVKRRAGKHSRLSVKAGMARVGEDADPPEVTVGERLFLETRFAQY
jgi:hypothetical protein